MRRPSATLCGLLLGGALACGDADPLRLVDGSLSVLIGAGGLVAANQSVTHPIGVVAIEEGVAAVADLAPCETWETIPPATSRTVPFQEILGWAEDSEWVLVYWCQQAGPADGGSVRIRIRR